GTDQLERSTALFERCVVAHQRANAAGIGSRDFGQIGNHLSVAAADERIHGVQQPVHRLAQLDAAPQLKDLNAGLFTSFNVHDTLLRTRLGARSRSRTARALHARNAGPPRLVNSTLFTSIPWADGGARDPRRVEAALGSACKSETTLRVAECSGWARYTRSLLLRYKNAADHI